MKPSILLGIGATSVMTDVLAGMRCPPVILFCMLDPYSPIMIRSNTLLFLFSFDIILFLLLFISGRLVFDAVILGARMAIPATLGNITGALIFDPKKNL